MDLVSSIDLPLLDLELTFLCSRDNTRVTLDGLVDVSDVILASVIIGDMT